MDSILLWFTWFAAGLFLGFSLGRGLAINARECEAGARLDAEDGSRAGLSSGEVGSEY